MVSQKYRGSCIGAALAKWLAKNTVGSQKMALEEKIEDGALEMVLLIFIFFGHLWSRPDIAGISPLGTFKYLIT